MVSDLTFNPKSSVLDELGMRLKDLSHKIAPHLPTATVKENLLCPGKIKKKLSLVFGLSVLGFSRNVMVQHGRLYGREPAPSLYKNILSR